MTISRKMMREGLFNQIRRAGQALRREPFWIVLNMSPHKDIRLRGPQWPFRFTSFEEAKANADHRAQQRDRLGWRFGVFEFTGYSAKVEVPRDVEVIQPREEREQEMQAA